MNEQQFLFLQQLLTDWTGIRFRDQAHLCRKFGSRLHALNLDSYARYIELIKKNPKKYLNAARVFKIWSAATSSGEEVYSIAMTEHVWAAARRPADNGAV